MPVIETKEVSIDALLTLRAQLKNSLRVLDEELLKILTLWQSKVLHGFHTEAIMQYRKEKDCTLAEAKEAVDSFIRSNKEG